MYYENDFLNDLFSSKNEENVNKSSSHEKVLKLPDATARKALELVGINASGETEAKLINFLRDRFSICHCCVLSMKSTPFKELGIDIGVQELVINEELAILYSPVFTSTPTKISVA